LKLLLFLALQLPDDFQRRQEALLKAGDRPLIEAYDLAKKRDLEYRNRLLAEAHREFIVKFNLYLEKLRQGANPVKERREAIKAWHRLESNEDFDAKR
jgi:hypothetical protein